MTDNNPGIIDWMTSPMSSAFKKITGGSLSNPVTPAKPSEGGGIIDGIEHMAETHPSLTALAVAVADHEVNGTGWLGSFCTYWAASDVLEGKATGLIGAAEKLWLANQFKDSVEVGEQKMGLGKGPLNTLAGWAGGVLSYAGMDRLESQINARKAGAPAPA